MHSYSLDNIAGVMQKINLKTPGQKFCEGNEPAVSGTRRPLKIIATPTMPVMSHHRREHTDCTSIFNIDWDTEEIPDEPELDSDLNRNTRSILN
jgi:hypothetical protein